MSVFKDEKEFKKIFEQIFKLMNEHEQVGRALYDARAPHRFVIKDYGLEFNVTFATEAQAAKGKFLKWAWGKVDWEPVITLEMASETANRYFQGKENIATAVLFGRLKVGGPMSTILRMAPVTGPIHPVYRKWLGDHGYSHLVV